MSSETPLSIGVSVEALWPVLQPRHAGISWGDPVRQAEAVVVYSGAESTVLFVPSAAAPPDSQPIVVSAQGLDGGPAEGFIEGVYLLFEEGSFSFTPLEAWAVTFHEAGLGPSLENVMQLVPLELLPQDVRDTVAELPFNDADDGEDMTDQEYLNALAEQEAPAVAPLFPAGLGGMALQYDTLLGLGMRPLPIAAGMLPPAGRGRALAAPPGQPLEVGALDAAGRGRGGRRAPVPGAAQAPRVTLASLSQQLAAMAATADQRAEAVEQRLGALEGARVPVVMPAAPQVSQPPPGLPGFGVGRPPLAVMGAAPKTPAVMAQPFIGPPPATYRAAPPGMPPRAAYLRPQGLAGTVPGAAAARGPSAALMAGLPKAPPATSVGEPSFHSVASATPAAADTSGFAAAMAEQAKAMAAMASLLSKGEGEDPISELALPAGLQGRGARGTAALHKWRQVFLDKPQAVTSRIRANRNRVMTGLMATPDITPSMRGYFAAEVPFGHARTAAYLTFGLADAADLMEAGRWHEAEALVLLVLAAAETAALQDWQWGLAWTLTFLSEPPWARIRVHPPAGNELRSISRLVDPELLAAAVGHMKDMLVIQEAQKKVAPTTAKAPGAHAGETPAAPGGPRRPRKGGRGDGEPKAAAAAAGAR